MHHGRGGRSKDSQKIKTKEWVDRPEDELDLVTISLPRYPAEFCGIPKSAKAKFPHIIPRNLPSATEFGRLLFPVPIPDDGPLHAHHPPYLAMRFELVVINKANTRLIHAWDCLLNKGVQFPESDVNRSSSPALHLGVWEVYRSTPCISTNSPQPEEVIIAMDIFLNLIKKYVAPEISNLLQTHCPIQYARQMQAYNRVHQFLGPELRGILFHSCNMHGITWVVPLGDWTSGEFCAPQLGVKIPMRPGQILGVMTKLLAHCGAPVTGGRRVILTLFTDHFLLNLNTPDVMVI
ncbi:hypothetical protein BJ912DRAFT_1026541 [Pholiota molesta]|nr:hypothetical protein BJ912DRAFT_1026541 [Pholiota molesta]